MQCEAEAEKKKEVAQLLFDVRSVLRCHQTGSVTAYPASPELSSFLATPVQKPPVQTSVLPPSPAPKPVAVKEKPRGSELAVLAEIEEEVGRCRSCELAAHRRVSVCGNTGKIAIRLMIIGHWLAEPAEGLVTGSKAVFGIREDAMLAKMLTAIHLDPEEVLITNVIKCSVGRNIQPQAAHIAACSSYLQRQIKAAAPKLICTMGTVAVKALLQLPHPLSRLRGRFHTYTALDGVEIPLLPTFHPGYLLQNPEMKKATWADLQNIEKRMAG